MFHGDGVSCVYRHTSCLKGYIDKKEKKCECQQDNTCKIICLRLLSLFFSIDPTLDSCLSDFQVHLTQIKIECDHFRWTSNGSVGYLTLRFLEEKDVPAAGLDPRYLSWPTWRSSVHSDHGDQQRPLLFAPATNFFEVCLY